MIQPLRRRHQRWFMVMAVFLPLAMIAGLVVRQPLPAAENLPATEPDDCRLLLWENAALWPSLSITTRVFADQQPATRLVVALQPRVYLKIPDLLVYWSADSSQPISKMTNAVFLLGQLSGTQTQRFRLPAPALSHDGFLALYSLAHQQQIAAAALQTRTLQTQRNIP